MANTLEKLTENIDGLIKEYFDEGFEKRVLDVSNNICKSLYS